MSKPQSPTRLRVLRCIARGLCRQTQIATATSLSTGLIAYYLRELHNLRLVRSGRCPTCSGEGHYTVTKKGAGLLAPVESGVLP